MIYDCVIIGSGVAGLTSALYLARANKKVLVIEDSVLGGTTATLDKIENYPGYVSITGMELIQNMVTQVSKLGVNIDFMTITAIDFVNKQVKTAKVDISYKTLIIAAGTSHKRLNLSNEDDFKFKGLSYCAVCDGSLYKKKPIVVATSGLTGKESVNYLKSISSDITVIDDMNIFTDDDVTIYHNSNISQIIGDNFVEGVKIVDNQGNTTKIPCSAIFVAKGKLSNVELYKDNITLNNGHIVTDENMTTNIPGVFAAGDIRDKSLRQIVTACADGAIAATECIKYLQTN